MPAIPDYDERKLDRYLEHHGEFPPLTRYDRHPVRNFIINSAFKRLVTYQKRIMAPTHQHTPPKTPKRKRTDLVVFGAHDKKTKQARDAKFLDKIGWSARRGRGYGVQAGSSSTTRHSFKKQKISKHAGTSKKKTYVPKRLRKQINEVTRFKHMPRGTWQSIYSQIIPVLAAPGGNDKQYVVTLGLGGISNHFTPDEVMQCASVLFNSRTPTLVPPNGNVPGVKEFDFRNFNVSVIKSFATYRFANRTQRTLTVKMYISYPKNNAAPAMQTQWTQGLAEDSTGGLNIQGIAATQLFLDPRKTGSVRENFKLDMVEFVLDPGQTAFHTIQGPKAFMYDFKKFWQLNTYNNVRRNLTPDVTLVITTDLCGSNVAFGAGRPGGSAAVGVGLLVELEKYYKIAMPEQTGFVYPVVVVGAPQPLTLRKSPYVMLNYSDTKEGTAVRIDEENPLVLENPALS